MNDRGTIAIEPVQKVRGTIRVPGDKSISHRAVMLGSLATGVTRIRNFLPGADCLSTIRLFQQLGVRIERRGTEVWVYGKGIEHFQEPAHVLNVGNSGTTLRLSLGILAACPFFAVLDGDDSIARRPMLRVVEPLREMGATIAGRAGGQHTPIAIRGGSLKGIRYEPRVASAQVKSALLLAGLFAEGETLVREKKQTRDHTERMLQGFGASVEIEDDGTIRIQGGQRLSAQELVVPGDISSAAFFCALAASLPGSEVTIEQVGLNPTRTGILDVLEQMGARVEIRDVENVGGEPMGSFTVYGGGLKGTEIGGDLIPRLIDEIPVIAVMATQAEGTTVIRDAEELRVKETDRIQAVVSQLSKMGAKIEATKDGMRIEGPTPLRGTDIEAFGDHRIAMAMAVAGMLAKGTAETRIRDASIVQISYPQFFETLAQLRA